MNGLVIKDTLSYVYKQKLSLTLFTYAIYIGCMFFIKDGNWLQFIVLLSLPLACSALPTTLFDMDGKCNFDRYAIALPFHKSDIVKGRYLSGLAFIAKSGVEALVLCILDFVLYRSLGFSGYVQIILWSILLCVFFMSFAIMSNYSIGVNGSVFVMLGSMVLAFVVYFLWLFFEIDFTAVLRMDPWMLLGIAMIVVGCLYYVSYRISLYYYKRNHA